MKIVVLNECFLNESHIKRLKALGDVEVFPNTDTEDLAIKRLKGADVALVDQFIAPFNKKVLGSTNNLKLLAVNTIGYGLVDLEVASNRGIKVANIPGYSKQSVAELTIGLIIAAVRRIPLGDRYFRQNPGEPDLGTPESDQFVSFDLKGKTLGIIGLGNIGTIIAKLGIGLGMKVIAYNRSPKNIDGIKMAGIDEVFSSSDVVVVSLSFSPSLEKFINKKHFELMKPKSVFVSITSPVRVVDLDDLYKVLKGNKIWGAALDIGSGVEKDSPLLKLDNVIFTPHIGSSTKESFYENLPNMIVENVESFLKGKPINIVN